MLKSTRSTHAQRTSAWFANTALSSSANAYLQYLSERGYAARTISGYFNSIAHFAHWSGERKTSLSDINEGLISRFLEEHLLDCRCAFRCQRMPHMVRAALKQLLLMLRANGQCAPQRASDSDSITAELADFDSFLADVRGLSPLTRTLRGRHVRHFLIHCFGDGRTQFGSLEPVDVTRFMAQYTANWVPASIRVVCTSLRSYFTFKASREEQTAALIAVLPQVAQWRLAGLPKQLSDEEVKQLLGAFDRSSATGRRDYAITRCLLDLGMRRTEVASLQLDDVDWCAGTLNIHTKGKRIDVLPLPQATGRAIAQYLQDGRPQTTRRELFVRHRPPVNAPANPGIVSKAVRYAAIRCGLEHRIGGTHILRHTLAAQLVQRGTRFKEIADLLRHRNLDTTTIYAKVDFPALEQVALPWPGRQV
ncbi:MAG: site-specific integrase [Gammaproteobacteria bacterium]